MGEMKDSEVRARLRAGDEEALELVFAEHRARLLRIARLRMPPKLTRRVDPEDVLQESFLNARKRADQIPDELSIFLWLRTVVLQTVVDVYRHHFQVQARGVDREVTRTFTSPDCSVLSGYFVASTTSPSLALQRQDLEDRIAAMLDEMDPEDRDILVMRHFEDASLPEVAEALGMSRKVAAHRYERALKRLSRVIQGLGPAGRDLLPGGGPS